MFLKINISTAIVLFAVVLICAANTSSMKVFAQNAAINTSSKKLLSDSLAENGNPKYNKILERNLFRAKLNAEIPKPKTEKELEEEELAEIAKNLTLKGVWIGQQKGSYYAVIDRGGKKGVWTYEIDEVIEKGLLVADIKKDSVILKKGDFGIKLKLFSKNFERTQFINKKK